MQATIQQRIAQGAPVSADDANRHLASMLQEGLTHANNAACQKHGVDSEQMQQAIKESADDPEVKAKVQELRVVLSGDGDDDECVRAPGCPRCGPDPRSALPPPQVGERRGPGVAHA